MFIEVLAVGCVDILLILTGENFGIEQITGETLPNFRQESRLKFQLEGQLGQLCPTFAKCRTRTGFDSNSKAEFGSGPVNLAIGFHSKLTK